MAINKILFVDTNIWLDFYRARNDAGLALLSHAEAVSEDMVVTYQLESEFKTNRQSALLEGMQQLKGPGQVPRPGMFSDAQATAVLNRSIKEADKRVRVLKSRMMKALEDPSRHDPIYQACQRIFHRSGPLLLTREHPIRRLIRRRAYRRFLHGCPPRKRNDTSLGDAFNWEWMIECAQTQAAELVIVTRDSDYGVTVDDKSFVNDHLKHEFAERVSRKRKILLYARLSEALKHFQIKVTKEEEAAEEEVISVRDVVRLRLLPSSPEEPQ